MENVKYKNNMNPTPALKPSTVSTSIVIVRKAGLYVHIQCSETTKNWFENSGDHTEGDSGTTARIGNDGIFKAAWTACKSK